MATRKTAAKKTKEPVAEKEIIAETAAEPVSAPVPASAPAPVYQVVAPVSPTVKILYIDSCIPNNEIPIGRNRVITGSGRVFTVTLEDFEGEFMTPFTMKLIDRRKFIVLDGLTDEQRVQYNCLYKPGEVLMSENMFEFLLDCDTEKAVSVFGALCREHREIVGTRFLSAWENGDNRINRDKVEALNAISKGDYEDGTGIFTPILKGFAETI